MPKRKCSWTVDASLVDTAAEVASMKGISLSQVVEAALTLYCSDRARHSVQIELADDGKARIRVSRRDLVYYEAYTYDETAVFAPTLLLSATGPTLIPVTEAQSLLRQWGDQITVRDLSPGRPFASGWFLMLIPLLAETQPPFSVSPEQLGRLIALLGTPHCPVSARWVLQDLCPSCGEPIQCRRVWNAGAEPRAWQSTYTCPVGHIHRGYLPSQTRHDLPGPPGSG